MSHTPLQSSERREDGARATGQAPDRAGSKDEAPGRVVGLSTAGNQAVQRLLREGVLQPKLLVSPPGDPLEQEADHIADHLISSAPPHRVQRTCAACATGTAPCLACAGEEPTIQPKARPGTVPTLTPHAAARIGGLGGGQPLPAPVRAFFEGRLGRDLGGVRVHTDAEAGEAAQSIQARAFTRGSNVVFGAGEYAPQSRAGQRLLAHELVHVVQQGQAAREEVVQRQPAEGETPLQPIGPRFDARAFLAQYKRSTFPEAWDIGEAAKGLDDYLEQHKNDYAFVRAVIDAIPSKWEDNLAAAFLARLSDTRLHLFTTSAEGRAALDVLYEAMITGDVSSFQREQSERILKAKMYRISQSQFLENQGRLMIFPIRNSGLRLATATFRAGMQPNGKVKVRYTSINVMQDDMFKADRETLPPWSHLREGVELDPEQMVAVRLHDEGGMLVPIPALALIDYSNQIEQKTLSTAATAFFLGLTFGIGALGGAAVRGIGARVAAGEASSASLWAARAMLWADRVAWGIQAGSMIINDQRDWIIKTFPDAGPVVVDAVNTANRIAEYYGWGQLAYGSLRFLGSRMKGAADKWRSSRRSDLNEADQKRFKAVENELDSLTYEMAYAEEKAARQAADEVSEAGISKTVTRGATGEAKISRSGFIYTCASPCTVLRDKYGAVFAGADDASKAFNRELELLEGEAQRVAELRKTAAANKDLPGPYSTANELAEAEKLAGEIERKALDLERRIQQANPHLSGVPLEESAVTAARQAEAESAVATGRLSTKTDELEKLRPDRKKPPANADPELWKQYNDYYDSRLDALKAGKDVKPPLSWEGYSEFLGKFRRGTKYQGKVLTELREEAQLAKEGKLPADKQKMFEGMQDPVVESNVAVLEKSGKLSKAGQPVHNYPDQLIVDQAAIKAGKTPNIHALSNKSRIWPEKLGAAERASVRAQVVADAEEALTKYGGEVTLKRPEGPLKPLYGQKVKVNKVTLVYDKAYVKTVEMEKLITDAAKGVKINGQEVTVIFR